RERRRSAQVAVLLRPFRKRADVHIPKLSSRDVNRRDLIERTVYRYEIEASGFCHLRLHNQIQEPARELSGTPPGVEPVGHEVRRLHLETRPGGELARIRTGTLQNERAVQRARPVLAHERSQIEVFEAAALDPVAHGLVQRGVPVCYEQTVLEE